MRWQRCPHGTGRCYENSSRSCPLSMRGWMDTVLKWAMCAHNGRSLDTNAVLGGLNIGGSESASVWAADVYRLFDHPDEVLGWMVQGETGKAPITSAICEDLRQAGGKWMRERSKRWADMMRECLEEGSNRHQDRRSPKIGSIGRGE